MQLARKMFRGFLVVSAALGLLTLSPKPGHAFTNGYNLIRILACSSVQGSEFDELVVYDSITGGALVMADTLSVLSVLPICANGGAFYAILNNGSLTGVVVYPGLK